MLTSNPYLSPQEVAVVESFMDQGGGVLAMGDHEDLGLGLCGGIKRVRSMRKWWFAGPIPPGMLPAPHSTDLTRNDTVQAPAVGDDVNAGEQHDATPQPIYPVYRYAHTLFKPHRRIRYPHPILCGPRGAIRVMPDHQHELRELRPELATVLGRHARDALGRIAPQCQAATWYFEWLVTVLPKEVLARIEDPKLDAERNPVEIAAIEALDSAAFGGIVNEVAIDCIAAI